MSSRLHVCGVCQRPGGAGSVGPAGLDPAALAGTATGARSRVRTVFLVQAAASVRIVSRLPRRKPTTV